MAIANAESLGQKQQVIIDGAFSWCWSRSKQAQGAEGQGGQGQARVGTSSEFNFEFRSWGGLAMKIRIKASPTASLLLGFRAGRDHSSPTDGPTISLVFLSYPSGSVGLLVTAEVGEDDDDGDIAGEGESGADGSPKRIGHDMPVRQGCRKITGEFW